MTIGQWNMILETLREKQEALFHAAIDAKTDDETMVLHWKERTISDLISKISNAELGTSPLEELEEQLERVEEQLEELEDRLEELKEQQEETEEES